jgi:hypothetical protein
MTYLSRYEPRLDIFHLFLYVQKLLSDTEISLQNWGVEK